LKEKEAASDHAKFNDFKNIPKTRKRKKSANPDDARIFELGVEGPVEGKIEGVTGGNEGNQQENPQ